MCFIDHSSTQTQYSFRVHCGSAFPILMTMTLPSKVTLSTVIKTKQTLRHKVIAIHLPSWFSTIITFIGKQQLPSGIITIIYNMIIYIIIIYYIAPF